VKALDGCRQRLATRKAAARYQVLMALLLEGMKGQISNIQEAGQLSRTLRAKGLT